MKSRSLLFLVLCILHLSCNNDDDNVNEETNTSNLVNAKASIASFDTLATIDLETGNLIASQDDQLIASFSYEDSFIGLFPDRLVRSSETDFTDELLWEYSFEVTGGFGNAFNSETVVIEGNTLYVTYNNLPTYYIEAIDLTNGTLVWSTSQIELEFNRISILNDRIITSEGPSNNTLIVSRNISDGSIINTWNLGERVSHLIAGSNEILVMSWSNAIYSIQEDLTLNWSFDTSGSNVQRGVITNNQFIFHSRDENIYALNLESGNVNWSQTFSDLFIQQFFMDTNSIWSITQDFDQNVFNIQELDSNSGAMLSSFSIQLPAANDIIDEIETLAFNDYILIMTGINGGNTITQFLNYKTQELLWENEVPLNNIFLLRANVFLENNRYSPTSF